MFARDGYYFNYHSDAYKKIIATLNVTTDPAKRTALKQDAQRQLANDYAAIFLFELADITVANKDLKGLWANAPTPAVDLSEVSWAQ